MEMRTKKLEDICLKICSGGTPSSKVADYYNPPTIPWLTTSEVNYSCIYTTKKSISENGLNNSSAKLIPINSVIVAMYGQGNTAGRVAINKIPLATNQACCNLIINPELADYRFVFYALSAKYNELVALKNGGAQPNLNAKKIREFEIPFPTHNIQGQIADILSAYDDMIDNCKQQIALLEEAAQRLYREWFVLGIDTQNNWTAFPVTEVYNIVYGKTLATKFIQKSGKYPVYGSSKCIGYYSKKTVDDYKVLITSRGNAGKVHRTFHKESFVTNNSFVVTPKADFSYIPFSYIYYSFIALDLQRIVNGSAQQQLTNAMLENVRIFLPDKDTLSKFGKLSDKYILEINTLHDTISFCNEAKSSLLPRLISGQIEIKE